MSTHTDRIETAQKALAEWDASSGLATTELPQRMADALRGLIDHTREDNAPETIAYEVIEERYGSYQTFVFAVHRDQITPLGVLNMLKDAAAKGVDSQEDV